MVLTSREPLDEISLPHEPGTWIKIRKLSGVQLQNAQRVTEAKRLQRQREMGAEFVVATMGAATPEQIQAARADGADDPLAAYDRMTLLYSGIRGWSYYEGEPKTEDIDDLDEETMQYVALRLVPARRTEEDLLNGSGASTTTSTAKASRPKAG